MPIIGNFIMPNPQNPNNIQGIQEAGQAWLHEQAQAMQQAQVQMGINELGIHQAVPGPKIKNDIQQEYDDFNQRFLNTYLMAKIRGGEPILIYIRHTKLVANDDKKIVSYIIQYFTEGTKDHLYDVMIDELEIIESMPLSKYVNQSYKGKISTLYFSRIPERQFKRGCCQNNIYYKNPHANGIRELYSWSKTLGYSHKAKVDLNQLYWAYDNNGWDFEVLKLLFNPSYPTFELACRAMFNLEGTSMAFSPYYCVGLSFTVSGLELYRKNAPIAEISKSGDQYLIQPLQNLFRQEILDLIRKGVITNSIVV